MGVVSVILGASVAGLLIQGGIYKSLKMLGLKPVPALLISAVIFVAIYTAVGGYGFADGGPADFALSFSTGLPAAVIVTLLFGFGIWRSSKPLFPHPH